MIKARLFKILEKKSSGDIRTNFFRKWRSRNKNKFENISEYAKIVRKSAYYKIWIKFSVSRKIRTQWSSYHITGNCRYFEILNTKLNLSIFLKRYLCALKDTTFVTWDDFFVCCVLDGYDTRISSFFVAYVIFHWVWNIVHGMCMNVWLEHHSVVTLR